MADEMITPDRLRELSAALGIEVAPEEHPPSWAALLAEVRRAVTRPRSLRGATQQRADAAADALHALLGRIEDGLRNSGGEADRQSVSELATFVALIVGRGFTEDEALAGLGLLEPAPAPAPVPAPAQAPAPAPPPASPEEFRSRVPLFRRGAG